MCGSAPKVPKVAEQVPAEPMKDAAAASAAASDAAMREQALRRGLASTFTRFGNGDKADTIGG